VGFARQLIYISAVGNSLSAFTFGVWGSLTDAFKSCSFSMSLLQLPAMTFTTYRCSRAAQFCAMRDSKGLSLSFSGEYLAAVLIGMV
jgi:hypothetical protein